MNTKSVIENTKSLIDDLKAVCSNAGLANSGGEYKIVTEAFLYKYLNDKFLYEVVMADPSLAGNTEEKLAGLSDDAYELLLMRLKGDTAHLKREHFLSSLFNRQNEKKFAELFDTTLQEISDLNLDRFSMQTGGAERIRLFDPISDLIETGKRDGLCRALVNKLVRFSFTDVFSEKYDFFAVIFEYLISDYNKDSGQYGEYYTPNSIARIIAQVLVPERVRDVMVYDPAAGTGTLLLALVHRIGEDRCSLYSQDISQKSSEFLRLNLILNGKVDSLNNVVQGNTLTHPAVFGFARDRLPQFDYVVSNPPFNMDFSETREELAGDVHKKRFFAGVPKTPAKKKKGMAVYLLFLQHILASMKETGKAAVVVPTGFLTAQNGIEKKIRERIVGRRMLKGVISMPPNIFATTGTNVSVLFLDGENRSGSAVLIDASKLGTKEKVGGLQRTLLSSAELERIVQTFGAAENVEDFCQVVSFAEMEERNCSFSAGQYFPVHIEHVEMTPEEFSSKIEESKKSILQYFSDGCKLEVEIEKLLEMIKYE